MAWPNPFRRRTAKTVSHYGYTFEWTDEHLSEEDAHKLRFTYDELADRVLARLDAISPPQKQPPSATATSTTEKASSVESEQSKPASRDLYALLRDNKDSDPVLRELWDQVTTVPEWVDWPQIGRGQDVFYRYGGPNLTGLAYQALLGGMGGARVVETLARTGGFSIKVARRRLFETTQHVLQVTRSLDALEPGKGEGFESTVRVRLLHAAVRKRILGLAQARPSYYSVAEHGVPINDLDSAATIATFSSTLIWLSLPRQGIFMRSAEAADYIAMWRYVAYLIGAPTDFFSTPSRAKAFMQSVFLYEIRPTQTSVLLANNIITALHHQPPGYASAEFLSASARWLNGPQLSDALQLPRVSLYYSLLMLGQCAFFAFVSYTYRAVDAWDRKKIEVLRKVFWQVVVESRYGLEGKTTDFDFNGPGLILWGLFQHVVRPQLHWSEISRCRSCFKLLPARESTRMYGVHALII
ncbi:hypothetical protein ANO11243_003480 [Dothideomycetidae sp. 11243]|nr:hypothetical protein ANO11243_003480 [fungal sp. No.11243]